MLIQDILRASLSQWTFDCQVCGENNPKSGPNQKCCAGCRPKRAIRYFKEYQQRRPKRGKRAIGDMVPCANCAASFALRSSKHKFCTRCAKPPPKIKLSLGQTFGCTNCGISVVKAFKRQSYCVDCRKLQRRNALPAYRALKSATHSIRYRTDPVYRARRNAGVLKNLNEKYAASPSFALNVRMRTAIGVSLAGQKRGRRWESLVGYTLAELMAHLERQFLPGMSWNNRGAWHVDHILPLSMFKFTGADDPEFKAAWALTNLRPLWQPENSTKWSRRTHLI